MARKQTPQEWCKEHLQPGTVHRIYFNPGNINNCRIHVRAIVDDDQVVTATWSRRRQSWQYQVKDRYYYELLREKRQLAQICKKARIACKNDEKREENACSTES